MSFFDHSLDAAMSRSYFEPITPVKRETCTSPRNSFSSDRTLIDVAEPQQPATSYSPSDRPSYARTITTLTSTTTKSTETSSSIAGKRKRVKIFLKRMGNGMLQSLAYVVVFEAYTLPLLTCRKIHWRYWRRLCLHWNAHKSWYGQEIERSSDGRRLRCPADDLVILAVSNRPRVTSCLLSHLCRHAHYLQSATNFYYLLTSDFCWIVEGIRKNASNQKY